MALPPNVQNQLNLILASPGFTTCPLLGQLLTLLLSTQGPFTADGIATSLSRSTGGAVRQAARRLRDELEEYYNNKSKFDRLRFKVELKTYTVTVEELPPATISPSSETPLVKTDLPPPSILPPRNNLTQRRFLGDRFVGRVEELWQVHQLLQATAVQGSVVSVSGLVGVGKSQIAIEYCYRFGHCYPDGVFWLDASSDQGQIAGELGAHGDVLFHPQLESRKQLGYVWKQLGKRSRGPTPTLLVVLDNVPVDSELLPLLPSEPTIATLVTTQRRALTEHEVYIPLLSIKESLELLNSGRTRTAHTADEAAPLIEMLDGLPLILELARGTLERQPNLTPERLVKQVQSAPALKGWEQFIYRDSLPSAHSKDILATFRQCVLQLDSDQEQKSLKDAKFLMCCLTHLAPAPVPLSILKRIERFNQTEGSEALHLAIDELESLSLARHMLSARDSWSTVTAHRMLLAYVQEIVCESDTTMWLIELCDALQTEMMALYEQNPDATELSAVRRHAVHLFTNKSLQPLLRYTLTLVLGLVDMKLGRLREAREWAQKGLQLRNSIEIPEGTFPEGGTAEDLGKLLLTQTEISLGNFVAARQCIEQIAARKERVNGLSIAAEVMMGITSMGIGQPSKADSWFQSVLETEETDVEENIAFTNLMMGMNLIVAGKYKEAQASLEVSMMRYKSTHPDELMLGLTRFGLGQLAMCLGDYRSSENQFLAAVEGIEPISGKDSITILAIRTMYGQCLNSQNRCSEALGQYDRVLNSWSKDLNDHPFTITLHAGRALALIELGKTEAAGLSLETVRRLAEAVDQTTPCLFNFYIADGRCALSQNKFDQAEAAFFKAVTCIENMSPNPILTVTVRKWLCRLYFDQGLYAEAQEHLDKARAAFGDNSHHPSTIELLVMQGQILVQTGQHSQAVSVLTGSMQSASAEPSPLSAANMFWLGKAHLESDAAMAEQVASSAVSIHEAVYPPGHLEISAAQQLLARAKLKVGKFKEAEELLQHALASMRSHLPEESAAIATTLLFLGNAHLDNDEPMLAEDVLEQSLKIHQVIYPVGHVDLTGLQLLLARAKLGVRKSNEAEALLQQVLETVRLHFSEHSIQIAVALFFLGKAHLDQDEMIAAEEVLENAVKVYEAVYQPGSLDIAWPQQLLARAKLGIGKPKEAEELLQHALTTMRSHLPEACPQIASTLLFLGRAHLDQKVPLLAEEVLEKSLIVHQAVYPAGHLELAAAQLFLAQAKAGIGKIREAEELLVHLLSMLQADAPMKRAAQLLLGNVLYAQKRFSETEPVWEEALRATEKLYLPDHVEVAKAKRAIGKVKHELGRYAEAKVLSNQALVAFQKLMMPSEVAVTQLDLGRIFRDLGELQQGEAILLEALKTFEESGLITGALYTRHELGRILTDKGSYEHARQYLANVVEDYRRTVPSSDMSLTLAFWDLGRVELFLDHNDEALALLDQGWATWEQEYGEEDPRVLPVRGRIAIAMIRAGRKVKGRRMLADVEAALVALPSENIIRTRFLKELKILLD